MRSFIYRKINDILLRIGVPIQYLLTEEDEIVYSEITDLDDFDF